MFLLISLLELLYYLAHSVSLENLIIITDSGIILLLQCSAAVGMKAFFDMMHNGPHKVILFGGACTQVTDPIAKASKHWRLTQVNTMV